MLLKYDEREVTSKYHLDDSEEQNSLFWEIYPFQPSLTQKPLINWATGKWS